MFRPGPEPSLKPGTQSTSVVDATAFDGDAILNRLAIRSRAHDDDAAAAGGNRRIGALVEQNRVVGDVAVIAESEVSDAAAVTAAHVSADPVVIEFVVVGTGAEGDTASPRRRGRKQFIAVEEFKVTMLLCTFACVLKQKGSWVFAIC